MTQDLNGLKLAILVAEDFEQVELTEPKEALESAGAQTRIVLPPVVRCKDGITLRRADFLRLWFPAVECYEEKSDPMFRQRIHRGAPHSSMLPKNTVRRLSWQISEALEKK
jgi:putative intracellular protease/amidase